MFHFLGGVYDSVFKKQEYKLLVVGLDGSGKTAVLERLRYAQKHKEDVAAAAVKRKKAAAATSSDGFSSISAGLKSSSSTTAATTSSFGGSLEKETKKDETGKAGGGEGKEEEPKRHTPIRMELIKPTIGLNIVRLSVLGHNLLVWDMGGKEALRSLWWNYTHQCHALIFVVDASDEKRFGEVRDVAKQLLSHPTLKKVPMLVLLNKMDLVIDRYKIFMEADCGDKRKKLSSSKGIGETAPTSSSSSEAQHGHYYEHGCSMSAANILEKIGILDLALAELEEDDTPPPTTAAAAEGDHHHHEDLNTQLDVPTGLTHTMGVGVRLFRVLPMSALYEEELLLSRAQTAAAHTATSVGPTTSCLNVGAETEEEDREAECAGAAEVESLQAGVEWLVRYLEPNARHVESI